MKLTFLFVLTCLAGLLSSCSQKYGYLKKINKENEATNIPRRYYINKPKPISINNILVCNTSSPISQPFYPIVKLNPKRQIIEGRESPKVILDTTNSKKMNGNSTSVNKTEPRIDNVTTTYIIVVFILGVLAFILSMYFVKMMFSGIS